MPRCVLVRTAARLRAMVARTSRPTRARRASFRKTSPRSAALTTKSR